MTTETKQQPGLKKFEEETVGKVLAHIEDLQNTGELVLPKDYVPGNALKFAWLHLQTVKDKNKNPALKVCTQLSVVNSLLEMTVKGMSVAKSHGAFIVRGNQLTWQDEYFGKLMQAKRDAGVKDVNSGTIYEGDEYVKKKKKKGVKKLVKHESKLENINFDKIRGAYAVVEYNDGRIKLTEMTMGQIKKAWEQGDMKGQSGAHKNFTDQMCEKTVITRACKIALNSSDDTGIIGDRDIERHPDMEARDKAIEEGDGKKRQVLNIPDAEEIQEEEPREEPKAKEPPKEKEQPPPIDANDDVANAVPPQEQQEIPEF